jgi:transcriptional regulator with XRE-family HTH domain
VSDLGPILREARERAGLSLAGLAARTGYSRAYLGNVETGKRAPTPRIIGAYQRAMGDDVNRRNLLVGTVAALAAGAVPDEAADVASGIAAERSRVLATVQTSHAVDLTISSLVARDAPSIASLAKWMRTGCPILRVNSAGILAKMRVAALDNAVAISLRHDRDARELYLTAVAARVLGAPSEDARAIVSDPLPDASHLARFGAEATNERDGGARLCSVRDALAMAARGPRDRGRLPLRRLGT